MTTGRIAAAHGGFSDISQVAPVCTPPNACFLIGLTRVQILNGITNGSAVLAQLTAECPIGLLYNGLPLPPQYCSFPWKDLDCI